MIIGVEDYYFYGVIILCILLIVALIVYHKSIKNASPDAFVHRQAKKTGMPVCRVHFRGKRAVDFIAEIEKDEQNLATPYWRIPGVGIKFKPGVDDIEIIEGSIPCANYYTSLTESMSIATVVAFSQLKDYFGKKLHLPIDNLEDVFMYAAADYVKTGDKKRAIHNAKIESTETQKYLLKYLDAIELNRGELENMKLESGVFTFQTAMKALDTMIGWTSAHAEELQKTVKAASLLGQENEREKQRQLIMMAIAAVILAIAGLILLFGLKAYLGK